MAGGDDFGDILEEKKEKNFKFAAWKGTRALPAFSLLGLALRTMFLYHVLLLSCLFSPLLLPLSLLSSPLSLSKVTVFHGKDCGHHQGEKGPREVSCSNLLLKAGPASKPDPKFCMC